MCALTLHDLKRFLKRPSLHLDDCASLEGVKRKTNLEVLHLSHFQKITSLEPLRVLSKLRFLSLSTTAGWDGTNRHLTVDSFEPLVSLKKLEVVQILGVVPRRGRLEPLSRIPSLRRLSIGNTNFYQVEDFAALSVSLVRARASIQPVCQMNFVSMCRQCRRQPLLFLTGAKPRSPRYACPSCGNGKIMAHLDRWNRAGGKPHYDIKENWPASKLLKVFGNPKAR